MRFRNLQRDSHTIGIFSILAAFLSSRLLCSIFVYLGHTRREYLSPVIGGWEGVPNWWLNPWTTYDSEWYLRIAQHGYDFKSTAFFPLFPWLLRLFPNDPVAMAWGGLALSHLAFLVALVLVFRLTELEWSRKAAHITVWLLAFSPAAPFWGAVYTESLFLMLLAATFLAARTKKWWVAGVIGGLAAACRNPGVLIAAALFLEGRSGRKGQDAPGKRLAWVIPLAIFIVVQTIFWLEFSDPLTGAKAHIYRKLDWPWMPIARDLISIFTEQHSLIFILVAATGISFTIYGLFSPIFAFNRLRLSYLVLIFGITLMNLTFAYQISPQTISATRYMAPIFPVCQFLSVSVFKNDDSKMSLIFTGLWLFLFIMFSYLFGLKSYLG